MSETALYVETVRATHGDNLSEQVEGDIKHVLEGRRPDQIRLIVERPVTDPEPIRGSGDPPVGEDEETASDDAAGDEDDDTSLPIDSVISYGRAVSALEDAGYETMGDLPVPEDMDKLEEINGVGSGTVETLIENI